MAGIWRIMLMGAVAAVPLAPTAMAQDKVEKPGTNGNEQEADWIPAARTRLSTEFDRLERKVHGDHLKGQLTRQEYLRANAYRGVTRVVDAEAFMRITRANEKAVTKDEYVEHYLELRKVREAESALSPEERHKKFEAERTRKREAADAEGIQTIKGTVGSFSWYVIGTGDTFEITTYQGTDRNQSVEFLLVQGPDAAAAKLWENRLHKYRQFWGFPDEFTARIFLQGKARQAQKKGFSPSPSR